MSDNANLIAELDSGCNDGTDLPDVLNRAARALEAAEQRITELEGRLRADIELMNLAGIEGPGAEAALREHDAKVWDECYSSAFDGTPVQDPKNPYRSHA